MSRQELLNFITSRFAERFTYAQIEFPNSRLDAQDLSEWVRIAIQFGRPIPLDLQLRSKITVGLINVQVFVKPDAGVGRAYELAQAAAGVFEQRIYDSTVFLPAEVRDVGLVASSRQSTVDSPWYQLLVQIPFRQT